MWGGGLQKKMWQTTIDASRSYPQVFTLSGLCNGPQMNTTKQPDIVRGVQTKSQRFKF